MNRQKLVGSSLGLLLAAAVGCSSDDPAPADKTPVVSSPTMMMPVSGTGTGANPTTTPTTSSPPSTTPPASNMNPMPGAMMPATDPGMTGTAGAGAPMAGAGA